MKNFVVDYESYYSKKENISAGTIGVRNYVRDSYAYLVSVVGPGVKFVGSVEEAQQKFPDSFWENPQHQFWAANANFDELWTRRYWPDAKRMKPWECILDRGATQQLPQSLAGIAKVIRKKQVDKTLRDWMDGKHFRDLSAEDQKAVTDYCLSDSLEEAELLQLLPEPTTIERKIAAHTRMANLRGVRVDADRLKKDREALHRFQHDAFLRIPWRNDGAALSHEQLAEWANARGLQVPASLAKDDEECAKLTELQPELAAAVLAMRQYRKANTLVRKIESLEGRLTEDNILPLELMYCGARHTRRWSSRGVNVQNLDREPYWLTADGKEADGAWNVWPRRWLIPRPGKTFLILDYSQIEPRCLNWLVGNDGLLNMIRQGFGIYEADARLSGLWTDPRPLKKANPLLYKLVKAKVLGLGYGMGAKRFLEALQADGITMTLEEARAEVKRWREMNHLVVAFWGALDQTIREAALDKSHRLEIEMPSGDFLRHFAVRAWVKTIEDEETGEIKRKYGYESITTQMDFGHTSRQGNLWGGTLAENVTQRMARDAMAEAVIRLEEAGLPVLFHAHDEVILEVDTDNRVEAKEAAEELMGVPPAWAPDLPLAVEGDFADHYVK